MRPCHIGLMTAGWVFVAGLSARGSQITIQDFLADRSVARAGKPVVVTATVANLADSPVDVEVMLGLPAGMRLAASPPDLGSRLGALEERDFQWRIVADQASYGSASLLVRIGGTVAAEASLPVRFLAPVAPAGGGYIPKPEPVAPRLLIGAHHCPLWEASRPEMWGQIRKHPERVPALGFYAQDNPEIADWETKWATEHGVSFFIYCWYRTKQGGPVETQFSSAIHDGLFRSRYADKMRFTIMWENQSRGTAGVADEQDLLRNLFPYWLTNYFQHPSYLKVDNKPLLFVYRPEFLVQDLGGVDQVVRAFDKMRQAARAAGFDGLYLLGEYRGLDPNHLGLLKRLGLDYTFAYCWYVGESPGPERAITTQMDYIRKTQRLGILPQVVTVSQGWSGWRDEGSIWQIPPREYAGLLRRAGEFVSTLPTNQLSGRLLLLDNWNEWGEGHYIAPYTGEGFGYLDAVREVFAPEAGPHADLIPEDLGLGPYDRAYREGIAQARATRRLVGKKVTKPGAPAPGLVGWWAFDEPADEAVAWDYSGHGLGGQVQAARRAGGWEGNALLCQGGCATIPPSLRLSITNALTIECRVKADLAGQDNRWMVNRVLGGGTDTGYRLGILRGKPCFEVPQTSWSHHLSGDADVPTGRWVHLAGTFDGRVMRLYMDGRLCGTMDRPGPIKPNDFPLCLGNYDLNHKAWFAGLLDEVRLYDRALSAEEIAAQAGKVPEKSER